MVNFQYFHIQCVWLFQIQIIGYNTDLYGNMTQAVSSPNGLAVIALLAKVKWSSFSVLFSVKPVLSSWILTVHKTTSIHLTCFPECIPQLTNSPHLLHKIIAMAPPLHLILTCFLFWL